MSRPDGATSMKHFLPTLGLHHQPARLLDAPACSIGLAPLPKAATEHTGTTGSFAAAFRVAGLVAIAALVGGCGVIFRGFMLRTYSPLPTGFDGPLVFRQKYLLEHHHFLPSSIPIYSYWSSAVHTQLGFYLMDSLYAAVLQISRWTTLQSSLIHQCILTVALISLGLGLLRHRNGAKRAYWLALLDVFTISALVTLGTPIVINYLTGWDEAYGWVLFLAVTFVAVSNLPSRWKLLLSFMLTLMGPPLYHTFGFLLVTYVVMLWLLGRLIGLRHIVVSPLPVLVCYVSYQIYVSTQFFGELMKGVRDVVTLSFLHRDPIHLSIAVGSVKAGWFDLRYVNLTLWALLSLPILVVAWRYITYTRAHITKPRETRADGELVFMAATVASSLAVIMLALMFGLKFSVEFLINRGAEYLIVPSSLAVIAELRHRGWYSAAYVYFLVGAILSLSIFSFGVQVSTVTSSTYLTRTEASGYAWLARHITVDDVVFTDFRLSGPFIADGHFRVVGITGQGRENTGALLRDIYYKSSPRSITRAIARIKTYHDGQAATYLFLSTLMMRDYPGLNGYGTHFHPVPRRFFIALSRDPDCALVYSNAQIRIYHVTHSPGVRGGGRIDPNYATETALLGAPTHVARTALSWPRRGRRIVSWGDAR